MKIKLFSKAVYSRYAGLLAKAGSALSFAFIFVDFPDASWKILTALVVALLAVAAYFCLWIVLRSANAVYVPVNGFVIEITKGDLFKQRGLKVIPFNERFDVQVDDRVVSKRSLNGVYIQNYLQCAPSSLSMEIQEDEDLLNDRVDQRDSFSYRLGSIHVKDDFALVAFSHVDENHQAHLTSEEYAKCLLHFWGEIDRVYAMRDVNIPLFGGGITRIQSSRDMDNQILMTSIVNCLMLSGFKPCQGAKVRLVLTPDVWMTVNPLAYEGSRVRWRTRP